jgi:hypothetical protein
LAYDLVWSDPQDSLETFRVSDRGVGYLFNNTVLNHFLDDNRLDLMVRSHEACDNGFERVFARCITVFSNTDYCGMGNDGAVVVVSEDTDHEIQRYVALTVADRARQKVIIPEFILNDGEMVGPIELSSPDATDEHIFCGFGDQILDSY